MKIKEYQAKTIPICVKLRWEEHQILQRFSAENEGNISATVRRIIREYAAKAAEGQAEQSKSTAV
jgi:ActR/RegA family two-component response regulator